jgi:hypothetical protein
MAGNIGHTLVRGGGIASLGSGGVKRPYFPRPGRRIRILTDISNEGEGLAGPSGPEGDNIINKHQPKAGPYHWWRDYESGTNYTSIASDGVQEITTRWGKGLKFRVGADMTVPSGGKMCLMVDSDRMIDKDAFLGTVQDWSGRFMLPAAGNPNGLPTAGNNPLLWEFHTETMSGNHFAIDRTDLRPRMAVYRQSDDWYDFSYASFAIAWDRWYTWRIVIKWATDTSGFFHGWIGEEKVCAYTARSTIKVGEHPYLQFGFYAEPQFVNEVHHADMVVSGTVGL